MKIIKVKSYGELSRKVADFFTDEIRGNPKITIGFATGETPLGLYKELVKLYKLKKIDFSKVKSFNLDEYYPIRRKDKNSFYNYMFKNLFDKVNINKRNINFLNGESKDFEKECLDYELRIKNNPIDLQILGVGINGHIGFNEPGSKENSKTRLVNLSKETIRRNSRFFKGSIKIPNKALTMGIKTILSSKKIILLIYGKDKKKAIKSLIKGKINSEWPVSFLKNHKDLIVFVENSLLSKS